MKNSKSINVLHFLWRLALFILVMFLAPFRIVNIIPLIAGIILVLKDSKVYGRVFGWLLIAASMIATIALYVVYSVEGGLMY